MSCAPLEPSVLWIDTVQTLPLCDVPWFGRAVVLSTGLVHFCCFSEVTVGNVHEHSFEEIWNGTQMQGIRSALTRGSLPWECQSPSCPIYKDSNSGALVPIIQRLPHDVVSQLDDQCREYRDRLSTSALQVSPETVSSGDVVRIRVDVRMQECRVRSDRYLALRYPDREIRFLPIGGRYPLPYTQNCDWTARDELTLDLPITDSTPAGRFEVGAALFRTESSPGLVQNCYWADRKSFTVVQR